MRRIRDPSVILPTLSRTSPKTMALLCFCLAETKDSYQKPKKEGEMNQDE